ncbi:MAG: DUF4252 domain-containing protein [Flavobacteriaceae bacterium]|nr:DUF4252 domain-containing protein [Flavobacteriaceae bacterium]MBL4905727.1 DUF4252 domain-containing protein [Flavobacteriaceae bacterium]
MKKLIAIIAFVAISATSYGQSIFDKLEDMDNVSSVVINKDAFVLLSKFNINVDGKGSEAMEVFKMIQDLKELKVFKTNDAAVGKTMSKMVKTAIKNSKMIELMRVKDKGSRVNIYVKTGKNKDYVSEVLMFVNGVSKMTGGEAESVVISLTGTIDINKLSKLADKFSKEAKKH